MKKILASILTIAMLMTTLSTCVIPASAAGVATDGFVEDFENYGEGNWLANMTEDGVYVDSTKISGMEANTWTVYAGKSTTAYNVSDIVAKNATMEVVADPKDANNKVLKLNAGDLGTNEYFYFRRNSNGGEALKHAELEGKKMVIKADMLMPLNFNATDDTAGLAYDGLSSRPPRYFYEQHNSNYYSSSMVMLATGSLNYGRNTCAKVTASITKDQWAEVKYVFDIGTPSENHPADTYRGFYNGSIYTFTLPEVTQQMVEKNYIREVNSKFPQPGMAAGEKGEKVVESWGGYKNEPTDTTFRTFGDFYGTSMSVTGKDDSATDYFYLDNLQVYFIEPFRQEGEATYEKADNGVWYAGEVRIPFNNNLMEVVKENGTTLDYKSLFYLKDEEGNVVENGVNKAYADGNELVIEPAKDIERLKSYTVWASPLFMDEEGQGLNQFSDDQAVWTFKTAEDPYAHIIYDFDFESYDIDGKDWIENRNNTTDRYVISSGVEEGTITINKSSSASENHKITVVADPAGPENGNKVLALSAGYEGNGNVTQIRFNANGKTGLSRANDMGKGKNLVYKTKIFIPETFKMTESSQLVNTATETTNSANYTSGIGATMSTYFYVATTGSWGSPMARTQAGLKQSNYGNHSIGGKWVEWKHVADVSEPLSATHSDTVRAYVNDRLVTSTFVESSDASTGQVFGTNAKYSNIAIGDLMIDYLTGGKELFTVNPYASLGATWWGSAFVINPQTDKNYTDTFYLDDVEAFWIDDLTYSTVNAENFEGGKVKINFNQKIRDNVEYYDGKVANVTNNASYKQIGLDGLFAIVDPVTKEVVENGIANIAISEDGKTISITPSAELEKGGDYQIKISEYLVDEYGQGLLNNSQPTYVDLHISETFTPFELVSLSQNTVSGFVTGRDVKITANFSVAVDDAAITNGIVVKNTETNETVARNAGWSAAFGVDEEGAVDYKTVVFDFGSLPTANYEITYDADFTAVNGADLASAMVITISKANAAIELFNENFDTGYTVGENWIAEKNVATDNFTNKSSRIYYTVNDRDWDVETHFSAGAPADGSQYTNGDFIGVAAAPEKASGTNMTGNALKISSGRGSKYSADYVAFRRNFNKVNGIDFSSEEYKGKKLVYEADLYADNVAGDNSFFIPYAASVNKEVRDYNDFKMLFSGGALRAPGHYNTALAGGGAMAMYGQITPSNADIRKTPVNYKMIISMGENVDTVAYYTNGNLVQRPESMQSVFKGHEWNDSARHEFAPSDGTFGETLEINDVIYGIWGLVGQGGSTVKTVYMDNFKAYLVDEFVVESAAGYGDVFNTAKGEVTYTFSKPVASDSAVANSTVVLVDEAGEVVAGGIKSAVLSDADYKLTVKLSDTLPGKTKYTVRLTEGLHDVDGLPLSTAWKYYEYPIDQYYTGTDNVYSITNVAGDTTIDMWYTPAANGKPAYLSTDASGKNKAAIDTYVRDAKAMKMDVELTTSKATSLFAEAGAATVDGANVSTTVTFTNPEVTEMGVWCVVAAFGEYNEMLGCTAIERTVDASSATEEIPVNFTASKSGIKSVKMFVWNNYDDMVPYHKAENLNF